MIEIPHGPQRGRFLRSDEISPVRTWIRRYGAAPTIDVSETTFYKRATFVAHLPVGHRYTASHAWLTPVAETEGSWRVGLTKFALRMLGELVEVRYEASEGQPVSVGDVVGNIEGFKAVSDLFCVVEGVFEGGNPVLVEGLEPLTRDIHRTWVYQVKGDPDPRALDVAAYTGVLDDTIDRMLAKQQAEEGANSDVDPVSANP